MQAIIFKTLLLKIPMFIIRKFNLIYQILILILTKHKIFVKVIMINIGRLFLKNSKFTPISMNIPVYTFILGRIFKKQKPQDPVQAQKKAKIQAEMYEAEKKKMKRQVEQENQYDMLQRQKDIELNRDFRKQQQKYKNTIPEDIGKSGFNQLVYWSQNAQTPQQIADMIKKFNNCQAPKVIEDEQAFMQFKQNVMATVYLSQNYSTMVDYAHFGYKYSIQEPQFWLKIQQKCVRRQPKTQEEISDLIDILFVMANVNQGQIIYSSSQKVLSSRQFTVQQIAKLIISFFKTSRGQKDWVIKLLASLQQQMHETTCDVLESILPILKQSKNVPRSFDEKLQKRVFQLQNQLTHSAICVISHYLGFEKGSSQLWELLQRKERDKIQQIKKEKGKIPSSLMTEIITGILSSYKFSTNFVIDLIIPEISAKQFKTLYRLPPTILSTLSKCLYIYELEASTQEIEQTIQGLIMRGFEKISQVSNEDLIHVLKDYTVTRLGSRQFYLFMEGIVNDKLQDIRTEKYTIETLTAIYEESNLCSTETLQLLKAMAYE